MNDWDISSKLCLLSASRAYSLQSPTGTRVTPNLVYNLVKLNTHSILVPARLVEEEYSQQISHIETYMCFATLLCHLV